ncbi:MAG: hypothetical protein JXR19_06330 [Bacteroidia bacterium]
MAQEAAVEPSKNATKGFLFSPHWAYQKVGGDLKERFYDFNSIGLGVDYKTKKNFYFGVDYDWYYGDRVKDSTIFDGIRGPSGFIIDQNGDFSVIRLRIKGYYGTVNIGYMIPLFDNQPSSGIMLMLGGGVMQHKIDIYSSQITIPQINGEYEYGYDRMAYGFSMKQFVGYQYLVTHNKFHFRAGVEFNQGFTQGRRTWNFSTNEPGTEKRFDQTTVFKFGIIVPVYTKDREDEEFFTN